MNNRILTNDDIQLLEIELTLKCQLNCHYCSNLFKLRSNDEIDFGALRQLILNFKNIKQIHLCGLGEPTLYSQLFKVIDFIHQIQGVKIRLFTNGTAYDAQYYAHIANMLNKNDDIIFSIFGSTNNLHSYYRVPQKLDDLILSINACAGGNANVQIEYIQMEYNHIDFQKCKNNNSILINKFNAPNITINYLDDCWKTYEQFDYIKAKQLKICTEFESCIKNACTMHILATNDKVAKKIFWCNSYDGKALFIDAHSRIFPCPDMRTAYDSIPMQNLLYRKYLKYEKDLHRPFKYAKQFINKHIFEYDDIYELKEYKEICNQSDYITFKQNMHLKY